MFASPSPSGYLMNAVWMEFAISFSTVPATCCLLLSAKSTTERAAAGVAPCSRCAGCLPSPSIDCAGGTGSSQPAQAAHAHVAHLGEGDLLRAVGMVHDSA